MYVIMSEGKEEKNRENGHSCIKKNFKEAQFLIAQIYRCMLSNFLLMGKKTFRKLNNTVAYYEILKIEIK